MRSLIASTLLALACSASAQAADLGVPRSPVAAAVMAPSFSWTGFYVGIDAGFWHGRIDELAFFGSALTREQIDHLFNITPSN